MQLSGDGITWNQASSPPADGGWLSTAYGAGTFVAVSSNGGIFSSTDGDNWVGQSSPVSTALSGITYGAGKFVASGAGGVVLESTDGVTWTQGVSGTAANLGKVTYGNGDFVISSPATGSELISNGNASSPTSVGTVANTDSLANISLSTITDAIGDVATYRAQNGAQQRRLEFASELLTTNQTNFERAKSRITDVDVADESTTLARWSMLVQAGTAMLSQANQSSQVALKLLVALSIFVVQRGREWSQALGFRTDV